MTKQPIAYGGTGSAVDNYFSEKPTDGKNWGYFDKNNSQHRYILSLMRQAKWLKINDHDNEVPDIERLSEWLKSEKSPVKKPLMDMDKKDLSKIIHSFERIAKGVWK